MRLLTSIFKDDRGATAVEYAIILAMIFLAMIIGVTQLGQTTVGMWDYVAEQVSGA